MVPICGCGMKGKELKINKVYWDSHVGGLILGIDEISIFISFAKPWTTLHKWLGWNRVSYISIYKLEYRDSKKKPPIRNLEKFLKDLIKNYNARIDKEALNWIDKVRKEYEYKTNRMG
jgi:hypothetical protein